MAAIRKILIVRFSSIGDIILTTPVIRSARHSFPDAEIHFATKAAYAEILKNCPYISKVWELGDDFNDFAGQLRQEGFDLVLDLHHNLRSRRLSWQLGSPVLRFPKRNIEKWIFTTFKWDLLPSQHIVERYAEPLIRAGGHLDDQGLEVWISAKTRSEVALQKASFCSGPMVAGILGATFATKKWPAACHAELYNRIGLPVVLLGGKQEMEAARQVRAEAAVPILDLTGHISLETSFAWLGASSFCITHDTGLMHAAAALQVPSVVIWGNTTPKFGMEPYRAPHVSMEQDISCRPCSKLGYDACPKGHFTCMNAILPVDVEAAIRKKGWV